METKVWYKSKSVIFGMVTSILGVLASVGVIPGVAAWVSNNPSLCLGVLGAVGVLLRVIKSNITILSEE